MPLCVTTHIMTPCEGSYCGQPVQDALALDVLLARTGNAAQIPKFLADFDPVNRSRSQEAILTSRACGQSIGMKQTWVGKDLSGKKDSTPTGYARDDIWEIVF